MSVQPGLFGDVAPTEPRPHEGADAARTRRQREAIASGAHPLSLAVRHPIPLHADAVRDPDVRDGGPRCGACSLRVLADWHGKARAKCRAGMPPDAGYLDAAPRVSHGPGTDVRAWWPACTDYVPENGT